MIKNCVGYRTRYLSDHGEEKRYCIYHEGAATDTETGEG
jgi:hypothetical protein